MLSWTARSSGKSFPQTVRPEGRNGRQAGEEPPIKLAHAPGIVGDSSGREPQTTEPRFGKKPCPFELFQGSDFLVPFDERARQRPVERRPVAPRQENHRKVVDERAALRTLEVQERREVFADEENVVAKEVSMDEPARKRRVASGNACLLYTSPSPRDRTRSRMPSSA